MSWPWCQFIDNYYLKVVLVFLSVFLLSLAVILLICLLKKYILIVSLALAFALGLVWLFPNSLLTFENEKASISEGTTSKGSLTNGKRIPYSGQNYETSSFLVYLTGRTHTHEKVRDAVLESYRIAGWKLPNQQFVLGECSWGNGGNFFPHKTHQNGLSVDFMTPLLNEENEPIEPFNLFNAWGYAMHFDKAGKSKNGNIDFEATAIHIRAVQEAATKNGLRIKKVIFAPNLQDDLRASPSGKKLSNITFSRHPVWVRHDNHYHIDFELLSD